MFRVPIDAAEPSFDRTVKVSLRRWWTASQAERAEWARRRQVAAEVAQGGQLARTDTVLARLAARIWTRRDDR